MFWTFISMLLVVMVHAYNLKISYLQPWTVPGEKMTINSFTQYFLANGIFRFMIPMLFAISGYLYAMQDNRNYKQRIKKRFRTLFLPYLIWSAFGLALTYILELFPHTRQMIVQTQFMQIDNHTLLLHQYKWYEWLVRWILVPVPYQLWFIRVLFIYNLAYPWLLYCVTNKTAQKVFFPLVVLFWLSDIGIPLLEGEGLLFFSLGIWIQKNNFNIELPNKWLNPFPWLIVFVVFATVKTWLAFKGMPVLGNAIYQVLLVLHKLVIFSGLIAVWFGSNTLVNRLMKYQWFVRLTGFSFIIYALHTPILFYANALLFPLMEHIANFRLQLFVTLPLTIILFCIATGVVLRKIMPKFYSTLTGGRGF